MVLPAPVDFDDTKVLLDRGTTEVGLQTATIIVSSYGRAGEKCISGARMT